MIERETFAVVVGIDIYGKGLDNLAGPVADAIRFTRILLERGLPAERIRLFVDRPEEIGRVEGLEGVRSERAEWLTILGFLRKELPQIDGKDLIFFWGGHGAVVEDRQRLFFSGSGRNDESLDFDHLLKYLRSATFPKGRFIRQIVVADACAEVPNLPNGAPGAHLIGMDRRRGIAQFALFAAGDGERAENMVVEETGLLSREFFSELQKRDPGEWPWDMDAIAANLHETFQRLRRRSTTEQTPYFKRRDWIGNETIDTYPSSIEAEQRYLVVSIEPDEELRDRYTFSTEPWHEDRVDATPANPARGRRKGIEGKELLREIGDWLNDYLQTLTRMGPLPIIEFVVPSRLLHTPFFETAICGRDDEEVFAQRLGNGEFAWAIRPAKFRRSGQRQRNLMRRWTPPAIVQAIEWISNPPGSPATQYQEEWITDDGRAIPLRCAALDFVPPKGGPDQDNVLLYLSAAGIPAVIWFHACEACGPDFRQALQDALVGQPLQELPAILQRLRRKERREPWNHAILLFDHHARMRDPGRPLVGVGA